MERNVFKGLIEAGTIDATFHSDFSNEDADLLAMMFAEVGGANPQLDRGVTSPGGQANVSLEVGADGVLEVWVAIGAPSDSGRLVVRRDGVVQDDEPISGSVRWVYAVET